MKMPFGKYKGWLVEELPLDYIKWLCSIELKGQLQIEVDRITQSRKYQDYLSHCSVMQERAEEERKWQQRLEKDYINDINFWGRVSPNAVVQTIRDNNIDVDSETWKALLKNCEKTPF